MSFCLSINWSPEAEIVHGKSLVDPHMTCQKLGQCDLCGRFNGPKFTFSCILKEEAFLSYATAIQEGVFLYMADDHPSKGHLTHTSHLTLICLSRSQQPFLV